MTSRTFTSCAAPQIAAFVRHRRAADSISSPYEETLRLFDAHCARLFPEESGLTQQMVDSWCARRPTESANSCERRGMPVASLVRFLRDRGETDVEVPELPRHEESGFVPHAFTDEELSSFFTLCDTWEPGRRGPDKRTRVRTKRTLPVVFRLLWSSGIRPGEARLLARRNVDLERGILRIVEGKGKSERLVALHPSMMPIMRGYDDAMEAIYPGRSYFFPNGSDGFISRNLLEDWFKMIWTRISDEPATVYHLRHDFCVRCINRLVGGGVDGLSDLKWVSKAMGHTSVDVTVRHYYHIVPALAALLQERSGGGFDDIVPGVM